MNVDACEGCGGRWFDRGELESCLVAVRARGGTADEVPPPTHLSPPRYLKCPVCDTVMTPRNYERASGVLVDVCGPHGAWLDDGERERLEAWVQSRRARRLAERASERARDESRTASWGTDMSARATVQADWAGEVASTLAELFVFD